MTGLLPGEDVGLSMTSGRAPKLAPDSPEVLDRVNEGLSLVDIIGHQLGRQLGNMTDHDELVAMGRMGLLDAARSFDAERGVPFRRWANIRIRGAMVDGVRAQGPLPRRLHKLLRAVEASDRVADALEEEHAAAPIAVGDAERADERLGVYLSGIATAMAMGLLESNVREDAGDPGDRGASAEELVARQELLAHARAAIAQLPDAERHLLERHYFDGVMFDDAAKELGLSKSWASRLHARAIEAVTRSLRRSKVR